MHEQSRRLFENTIEKKDLIDEWCSQEKQEWGALYIFKSEEALEAYVQSDIWQKMVPEKYGCVPTWTVVEPGPILSKKEITNGEDSWIGD